MKYLIANKVVYDTESGELNIPDSGLIESKKLTHTANRILSLLIASPGEVLERQYLLEQVWESVGHVSSSSSLNQYISILRKTLTSLTDIEESIIVVPKVGFFFSADIDVRRMDEANEMPGQVYTPKKSSPLKYAFAVFIVIVLLIANLWVWYPSQTNERYSNLAFMGNLEKCTISTYGRLSADTRKRILEVLRAVEPNLNEKCLKHPIQLMVNIQPSVFYGSRGRIFYSLCSLDPEDGALTYCENHYAFNWGMK
ncbi:transcriptional regulator [Kluyvera sp. STS39-E]|uniref:transcriptional regulator n=1 Tax=Kluyvera sp. STS39-E TaxID=3234748 RepID=UPI0034C6AA63